MTLKGQGGGECDKFCDQTFVALLWEDIPDDFMKAKVRYDYTTDCLYIVSRDFLNEPIELDSIEIGYL